ncbi:MULTISPECIES: acyl-CoA dehydrogenase family protein [Gordonia]|uniref:acyl-CoA dehydrogenase family protein n=1 Tax=Gordonia TaxID=2053 RepID=UPI000966530F|nr:MULTISPECIES: acyl-CoA dehydrogenase family protein [Gordonia]MDH3008756.1 acyl-CoA/acyl-ACP dehydrogenase [Gordonia alkanivorans]MDH3012629.1 acyl-CoA/acyl-ACP dehydrogenase [Gordonia alkanivorans]MDH3022025.1 acyl-CoA/acyl-ACP dehydrogenase [Gordonia alkanivorans]MDH3025953.1 acyl-CoA/acyl-ACP dehydrogenase [Gordonia alkanivorans]MDH3043045.1 acyl-CoA/acyl-ACP dehydrogenase [Gordonia alkanivorans]
MDLLLDDERAIADLARDYFAANAGAAPAHSIADGAEVGSPVASSAELGWFGLTVAESAGGLGLSTKELAIAHREAGRALAPLRLLATTVAATAAAVAGDEALLKRLLAGDAVAAIALSTSTGYLLLDADTETSLAVSVLADSTTVTAVTAGDARPADLIDPATPALKVATLGEVLVSADASVSSQATLAIAAAQIGIASASLDMAVDYARDREAFGKPIGSFQAIKHRLADVGVALEAADAQLFFAATAAAENREGAGWEIAAARLLATRAATAATSAAIQTHGAMGITWDHDAHLYLERATLLDRIGPRGAVLARELIAGEGVTP